MSKAVKTVFNGIDRAANWVKKNALPVLAVAAIIYTGGAALGVFGSGATGFAGIESAWSGLLSTGAAAGASDAAATGATDAAATAGADAAGAGAADAAGAAGAGAADAGAGAALTPAEMGGAGADAGAATAGADTAGQSVAMGGMHAAADGTLAGANAAGGNTGLMAYIGAHPGTAILGAAGISAGGSYLQQKSAEDQAKQERNRYDSQTYDYGVNRKGEMDPHWQGGDWNSMYQTPQFSGGGLMAPAANIQQQAGLVPPGGTPTTIDQLIAARQGAVPKLGA